MSDVPINHASSLVLPIYVFDCPLSLLVDAYVTYSDRNVFDDDVYEDHRFKFGLELSEESSR